MSKINRRVNRGPINKTKKDHPGCNGESETDKVHEMFSTGKVSQCNYCHYSEHLQELPDGDISCQSGQGTNRKCRKYEDSGCYSASNWHTEKGQELQEFVRGCSSFIENEVHKVFYVYLWAI